MRCVRVPARLLVTVLVLLIPASACAETLEEAWQLATEHDPVLAAAGADVQGAQASERAARSARWPALTAHAGYTRFSTAPQFDLAAGGVALQVPIFAGDDFASGGVQAQLPLYTGGRISAAIRAAHQTALGASETQRSTLSSLRLGVAQSYVDVLRARRALRAAESSVASLRAHASDVERMVERELVARSDLLAARVALANANQQFVRAENRVALAYAAYNRRLGQPLGRTPDLTEAISADSMLVAEPVDKLIARALDTRAEIGALSAQADAIALQSKAARAELLPQLAISGDYTYFENEILDRKDFSSVAVGIRWNLFDGGAARHRSAALRHASRAAQQRLQDLRTLIELEVREAWLDLEEARARVAAAREAVAESDENLRITRELYGTGLGTNTQVLDAVALQVAATSNRDNATLDQSMALLRLTRAVGAL